VWRRDTAKQGKTNMRVRYKDDGLGEMRDGDILRVRMTMMDNETMPQRTVIRDAAMHRPGFRVSSSRLQARDQINEAYAEYEQCLRDEYKNPLFLPRGSQFGDRDPEDEEQRDSVCPMCGGTGVRPGAKQTGWLVGERGDEGNDDDETQQGPWRATTRNEGAQRRHAHMTIDELRSHHADVMREIYEGTETDTELAQLWRHEK
jgi:hypothetical protein